MCFVRLPIPTDELHVVGCGRSEERRVGTEHVLSLLDEISEEDLAEETEIPAEDLDDAADPWPRRRGRRLHPACRCRWPASTTARTPCIVRTWTASPTRIALAWPREADDEIRQEFVGVVRGRTVPLQPLSRLVLATAFS